MLALGQNVDQSLLTNLQGVELNPDGVVEVGPDMMTAFRGVFAGGDMVPSERTVTVAVGHGKKAARNVHAFLRDALYAPAPKHEVASFEQLNTCLFCSPTGYCCGAVAGVFRCLCSRSCLPVPFFPLPPCGRTPSASPTAARTEG